MKNVAGHCRRTKATCEIVPSIQRNITKALARRNKSTTKKYPPPSKAHQSQQQIEASRCSGRGRTQTNCAIGTPTGYTCPIRETHCKTSCIVISPLDPGKRQFSATSETKPKKNDKYTEGKASIRGKKILYFVWSHHDIYTFCDWQIFWHSIWHIFWHSIWHSIWHIFWHSTWHIFCQML